MIQRKGILVTVFVVLTAVAAIAQSSAVQPRITQAVDERQLVKIPGTVHPLAQARYDGGAAPDDMPLERVHLVLKRSPAQESTLRQFISDVHRPGSSNYHKWLTPEQFGEQFGPADQDIATVQSWLGSHGFQVTKVQPGKQVIEFSGNVAQMREAFHTQIHKYVVNGETHTANANDPQIPAALAPVVGGFVSLNNFRIKNNVKVLGKATYNTLTHTAQPQWTYGNNAVGITYVLSPADYAIQYDLQPLYNAGTNGSNQTIAIVNDSNINITLVNQFRTLFNLSPNPNPPQVIIDGNDPGIDGINNPDGPNNDSIEAYLDVEWAGAVAPAATIDLVIGADTALESGLVLAMEHAVSGNIAPVISLSFGECEAGLGSGNTFFNTLWEQAAAQGISAFVSSGDSGSAGAGPFAPCDNDNTEAFAVNGLGVNGFASTPYNIAVGGTDFFYSDYNNPVELANQIATYWNTTPTPTPQASLVPANAPIPEQPWNNSQYGLNILNYYDLFGSTTIGGGSGGASSCEAGTGTSASGGWATCTAGYPKPSWQTGTGVPADGVRDLPDLSLFAANGGNLSYYPICAADGDCQPASPGNLIQITGVGGTSASTPAFAGVMALINQKYGPQGQAGFVLYPLKAQFPAAFHDILQGTNSVPCEISPALTPDCIAVATPIVLPGPITEGQLGTGTTPDYNAAAGYNLATGLGTIDANQMVTNWGNIHFNSTTVSLTSPTAGTNINHGSPVTFSGTVTASGGGTPGGNVAIMTDSTEPVNQGQVTIPVSNGAFSSSFNALPGGTYNVWVNYGGDGTNGSSASGKVKITVNPEASTTFFNVVNVAGFIVVGPGATNFPYGTQLMLAAEPFPSVDFTTCINTPQNCPRFTAPTGTVTFSDSGSAINTAVVNTEGDAEYNAPWSVGAHSVTAAYSGDSSYNASNAGPIAFTIAKATPTLIASYSELGQPTVFTVQVENTSNSIPESTFQVGLFSNPVTAPTGTVTLSGLPGGTLTSTMLSPAIDPSDLFAEGVATITVPSSVLPQTYNNVTFNYAGDVNYNLASLTTNVTVASPSLLASTTAVTGTTGSISPTTTLTVNGTVTGQSGHAAPTGSVLFASSGFILGQLAITPKAPPSDVSTFSVTLNSQTLFQGANAITIQYSGDSNYGPSATTLSLSNPLSDFSIVPTATIVPVNQGSSAMDTIQVSSKNGFSGMVTFNCTAPSGVTCPSPSAVNLSGGSSAAVTLNINASATATAGNNNILLTATSGAFVHTLTIQAVVIVVPSFAAAASAVTVTAGSSGNATITLTPSGGFTGTVAVTCPAPLPPGVTCSPSPLNINVTSNAAAMGQLTLSVTAPSTAPATAEMRPASTGVYASLQGPPPAGKNGWWKLSAGTGLAAMFLMFLPGRRRYRSSMCLWLVCLLSFAMGCGGSSSGGGVVAPPATTTKITAPATKVASGTGLTFNVAITLTSTGVAAGNGTVQLLDGGTVVTTTTAANGVATFSGINSLSVGTHSISAHYLGDSSTGASSSGTVNVTITGNTMVSIATNPASSNNNVAVSLTIQ